MQQQPGRHSLRAGEALPWIGAGMHWLGDVWAIACQPCPCVGECLCDGTPLNTPVSNLQLLACVLPPPCRYHLQILFVDHSDQLRAKLAAAFFEQASHQLRVLGAAQQAACQQLMGQAGVSS